MSGEVIIHFVPIPETEKGAANGVATLDGTGQIPLAQIPDSVRGPNYLGTWNADTNTPVLADGGLIGGSPGENGDYYIVSVAGATTLDGDGPWAVGDWAIIRSDGVTTAWERIGGSAASTTRLEEVVLAPAYEGSSSTTTAGDGVFRLSNDGVAEPNGETNFYEWTTAQSAGSRTLLQYIDWYVPRNFSAWASTAAGTDWTLTAETTDGADANNGVTLDVYDTAGVAVASAATTGSPGVEVDLTGDDGDLAAGTYTAGSRMRFRITYTVLGGVGGAAAMTRRLRINYIGTTGANP